LVILAFATAAFTDDSFAGGLERCATEDSVLTTSAYFPAQFHPHRVGGFLTSLSARDIQFQWDTLYPGGLSPTVLLALEQFLHTLVLVTGTSPLATDAKNLQAVYNYTHREPYGLDWNATDPADSTALRVGYGGDPPPTFGINLDRSHVDTYVFHPDWDLGGVDGQWPSYFETPDEDLDTGHPAGSFVPHLNSIMFRGPHPSDVGDLSPGGWTGPTSIQRIGFNHELQHGLKPDDAVGGAILEFCSAVAEAVGGIANTQASDEFPYTWPLFAHNKTGLQEPPFVRQAGQNYQARTAFAAYLAYQFLGTDTARTLAGMTDDLLYKWMKLDDPRGFPALRDLLTNSDCGTCAQRAYLHEPSGAPLSPRERLMLIHHNWRVANFVNNTNLAEGQFGYPAFGGFSPAQNQRAWQSWDPYQSTDIVALPDVRTLNSQNITRDMVLAGDRTFRTNTYPMSLVPYAANYWVLRAGSDLTSANRDLVVRVAPRGCFRCRLVSGTINADARLMASAIAYSISDAGGPDSTLLWQNPAGAVFATPVQSVIADSVSGSIELVIPNFGSTHRAVLIVLTAADGELNYFTNASAQPYVEALPYRLEIGVRTAPFATYNPTNTTDLPLRQDREPTWSPNGEDIAFSVTSGPSGTSEIWTRKLDMNAVIQPPAFRLVPGPLKSYAPDWSPRGDVIAYAADASTDEGAIWVVGPGGASPTQLTFLPGRESMPAFQPDGQGLAYLHQSPGSSQRSLRWVSRHGDGDVELAQLGTMTTERRPRWSPDGTRVLISLESAGNMIHSVPKSGGSPELDGSFRYPAVNFDLPRNGNRVVFASSVPIDNFSRWASISNCPPSLQSVNFLASRLALIDTTAAGRDTSYRFVQSGLLFDHPRISPDGTRMLYQAQDATTQGSGIHAGQFTWNHAPKFTGLGDIGLQACVPFQTILQATDADGEAVTLDALKLPSGSQFISGNTFRWQHPSVGDHYAIFRARDGSGGVDTRVVRISVIDEGGCGDPLEEGDGGCGACLVAGNGFRAAAVSSAVGMTDALPANSFMNGALPGSWLTHTARLTRGVTEGAGEVVASLRAMLPGSMALDCARLLVVDHPADASAIATTGGIVVARPQPLPRLVDAAGCDWLAALDHAVAEGGALDIPAGTELTAEWTAAEGFTGLVMECARAGGANRNGDGGVEAQTFEAGSWTKVDRVHPRRGFDDLGLLTPGAQVARLVFLQDTRVRSIRGFAQPADGSPGGIVQEAVVSGSDHVGGADALTTADGRASALARGEAITMTFPASARVDGSARSYFLALRAAYTPPTGAWSTRLHPAGPETPVRFAMFQNQPNPFAFGTTFRFDVPKRAQVRVEVFDLLGRRVTTLVDQSLEPGAHAYDWDGTDSRGATLPAGVYLYRMTAGEFVATKRLILMSR
jgi:Tol biopolymer transport system component